MIHRHAPQTLLRRPPVCEDGAQKWPGLNEMSNSAKMLSSARTLSALLTSDICVLFL